MRAEPFFKRKEKKAIEPTPLTLTTTYATFDQLRRYVRAFTHEIMLLGVATRNDRVITIEEWLIPPQTENTGAFVTTDDATYPTWIMNIPNEKRQKIRVHLHTHPSMATSPSGTDENTLYEQLENIDDFYVRIIANQNDSYHIDIFDIENHTVYHETTIRVTGCAIDFGKNEKTCVIDSVVATAEDKQELEKAIKKYKPNNYDSSYYRDRDRMSDHGYPHVGDYGVMDYHDSDYYRDKTTTRKPRAHRTVLSKIAVGEYAVLRVLVSALESNSIDWTAPEQDVFATHDRIYAEQILHTMIDADKKKGNDLSKDTFCLITRVTSSVHAFTCYVYKLSTGNIPLYHNTVHIDIKKGAA